MPDRFLPEKFRRTAVLAPYCPVCGRNDHTKRSCPALRHIRKQGGNEGDIKCDYPLCPESGHYLCVCPALHGYCTCGLRGHSPAHCSKFSAQQKEEAYKKHRPQGTALSKHINDKDWDFRGPVASILDLVPVYTYYTGYMFVEAHFLDDIMAVTTTDELKEAIHAAHYH